MSVTPGELVQLVADQLRLPEVTVGAYYRSLREEGLVTKGGRGRSSPQSTMRDASTLILALLCAPTGAGAAEQTQIFAKLPCVRTTTRYGRPPIDEDLNFRFLEFLAAVEMALIEAGKSNEGEIHIESKNFSIGCTNQYTAHIHLYAGSFYFAKSDNKFVLPEIRNWTREELSEAYIAPRGIVVDRRIHLFEANKIASRILKD